MPQHRMVPFAGLLPGWATTTGRLLGPKNTATRYHSEGVEPRFYKLSIANLAFYQMQCILNNKIVLRLHSTTKDTKIKIDPMIKT